METDNIGAQSFLMTDGSAMAKRISRATWVGLFLSLFVMLLVRQSVSYFWPTLTFTAAIWKETLLWVSAITLLLIIRRGERLPLTSIGLGTYPDRAGARRDSKRFLSLAPRSRCQHDRPRYGGLYCKRLAEPFFLSASGHPQVTVARVADHGLA